MTRDRSTLQYVREVIDNEGFEYAFVNYSNFEEVVDEKFHLLRRKYLKAIHDMKEYLMSNIGS